MLRDSGTRRSTSTMLLSIINSRPIHLLFADKMASLNVVNNLEGGLIVCGDPAEAHFLYGVLDLTGILYRQFYRHPVQFIYITLDKDFEFVKFLITERGMKCTFHHNINQQHVEAFCHVA